MFYLGIYYSNGANIDPMVNQVLWLRQLYRLIIIEFKEVSRNVSYDEKMSYPLC